MRIKTYIRGKDITLMSDHKQFTKCLITGKDDLFPLKGYEKDYLVKSKSSGLVFCSRIATEKELTDHYSSYPIGYNAESEITRTRISAINKIQTLKA